jgi:hypothetical protein
MPACHQVRERRRAGKTFTPECIYGSSFTIAFLT